MLKIHVLGSGTCASDFPNTDYRYPPAFMVTWEGGHLLIDCSEGVRKRLLDSGFNYGDIEHIAICHAHADHNALVHFVQSRFCQGAWWEDGARYQEKSIDVYCPNQLADDFPTIWKIYFPEKGTEYPKWPKLQFHKMSDQDASQNIGNAKLSAAKVYHAYGKVDAVGFRLETPEGTIAYSGDTGDCEGVRTVAKDADIFFCEASAKIGDEKAPTGYGHLNPFTAGLIAKDANAKHLVLYHHTGLDSDEAMIEDVKKSGFTGLITIAKDSQIFQL